MKHTQGKQSYYVDDDGYIICNKTEGAVAHITDADSIQDLSRILDCHDALLEACEEMHTALQRVPSCSRMLENAKAAIAAANTYSPT